MVHRREIEGEPIGLGIQGALWGNAMTWWDHETGSIWSQPLGEAIAGPLTGTKLELLPSTLTSWGEWKQTHPESLALDAPGSMTRYDLAVVSIVVEIGEDSMAFPMPTLRSEGVANAEVSDLPVAVALDGKNNWAVFSRIVDGRPVELAMLDGVLVEVGGEGRWDPVQGLSLDGNGPLLDLLPGFTSFDGDYETFFPSGAFWRADGPPIRVS
jgi:hypothetical protein